MKKYFDKVVKILSLKELRILPSYLSYNFVLAIIPMFTIIFLITSLFSISIDSVVDLIRNFIPNYIGDILIDIISSKSYNISIGFLNLITLYASSRGMYAIVEASNSLYNVKDSNVIKNRLKSFLILFLLIISLIFLIFIPILGGKILDFLDDYNIIAKNIVVIYRVLKWPITILFIYFNVKIIYMIAPSVKVKGSEVMLGAFTTTILWSIFTALFEYYLTYFSKYDVLYGSLSSITVLLIWIYFLSYILILGIVINTKKYNKI